MSDKDTTADLMKRLRRHYLKPGPLPGGIFIEECGINGQWGLSARCDALYAGFTSASGRLLVGHEVKASRADWRKELDTPGKADTWADQCHAWYIVAPSTEIVRPEELPHGWGLMIPNPRTTTRMIIEVKAEVHAQRTPSWDAVRSILARYDTLRAGEVSEAAYKSRLEAQEQVDAKVEALLEGAKPMTPHDRNRLVQLDRFEEALGRKIDGTTTEEFRYVSADQVAKALRIVQAFQRVRVPTHAVTDLERVLASLHEVNTSLREYGALLEDLTGGE